MTLNSLPQATYNNLQALLVPTAPDRWSEIYLWRSRESEDAWKLLPQAGGSVFFQLLNEYGHRGAYVAFYFNQTLMGYVMHGDYPKSVDQIGVPEYSTGGAPCVQVTIRSRRPRRVVVYRSIDWGALSQLRRQVIAGRPPGSNV